MPVRNETIKRIMVGVDGSGASLDALRWGCGSRAPLTAG
jgi:hypothetical protein